MRARFKNNKLFTLYGIDLDQKLAKIVRIFLRIKYFEDKD